MPTKTKITSRTKSGTKQRSKISTKLIAAIIIGIVAIAGIAIVFSSFASGLPAYQYSYSASCEKKTTNINIKTNQIVTTTGADIVTVPVDPKSDCVKNSAEAMAFRLYQTVYGKSIDYNTFKTDVQKLAGDRTRPQLLIPDSAIKDPTDNREFVKKMYKNILGRTPSESEVNGWINNIDSGKVNRQDVAYLFAASTEAGTKNSGPFASFIKANPAAVNIAPTAQNQQNERTSQALAKLKEMVAQKDNLVAEKNQVVRLNNYDQAKPITDRISLRMIRISQLNNEVQKLAGESAILSEYATNINNTDISNYSKLSQNVLAQSWTATIEAGRYAMSLNNPNGKKTAVSADDKPTPTAGCNIAYKNINANSSSICIKALQAKLGLAQTGKWNAETGQRWCFINSSNPLCKKPNSEDYVKVVVNPVGTSMCVRYKPGESGRFRDFQFKTRPKLTSDPLEERYRNVTCFGSAGGYASYWSGYKKTGGDGFLSNSLQFRKNHYDTFEFGLF